MCLWSQQCASYTMVNLSEYNYCAKWSNLIEERSTHSSVIKTEDIFFLHLFFFFSFLHLISPFFSRDVKLDCLNSNDKVLYIHKVGEFNFKKDWSKSKKQMPISWVLVPSMSRAPKRIQGILVTKWSFYIPARGDKKQAAAVLSLEK